MMRLGLVLAVALWAPAVRAEDEYSVKEHGEAAPSEGVAKEVRAALAEKGLVVSAGSKTHCHLWLAKDWALQPDFKATAETQYGLQPGGLVGVVQFARQGEDFRQQTIRRGLYTLRYGQQPVDGNHVGTSPTRDFLVLLPAAKDESPKPLDYKDLVKLSSEAAGSKHPAIWSLQKFSGDAKRTPTLAHQSDHDWQLLQLTGRATAGGKTVELPLEVVLVGHAAE